MIFLATTAAFATAASAQVSSYLLGIGHETQQSSSVYLVDVSQAPPQVQGPYLTGTFGARVQLFPLRDAPRAVAASGAQLSLIDFANPLSPQIVDDVTLPFFPSDITPLGIYRDELLVAGPAGQLVVLSQRTLDTLASFTLSNPIEQLHSSPDGRWLVTETASGVNLAAFDRATGLGTEVSLTGLEWEMSHAIFSTDNRTLVLHETACWGFRGPPFCLTTLGLYDLSAPAAPVRTGSIQLSELGTSSVRSRSGHRFYFHLSGSPELVYPHRLYPFDLTGPGTLSALPYLDLAPRGDYYPQYSGIVRSAGAKNLLVTTSWVDPSPPNTVSPQLHIYETATGSSTSFTLPTRLHPEGVLSVGAALFADGFESGTHASWSQVFP